MESKVSVLVCAVLSLHLLVILCRNVCLQEFPQSLPKLLQSVCWNNRSEVAQVSPHATWCVSVSQLPDSLPAIHPVL